MKELLIALLIVVAVFVVSFLAGPTGYATYKFDKLTVSGGHALLTQTFSPNGDKVADYVYGTATGSCPKSYGAAIAIYDSSGSMIKSTVDFTCIANYCNYKDSISWDGKDPGTGKVIDGTYTVRSGCYFSGHSSAISIDKVVTITLNSKLYPASINYGVSGGVACGTKPTCTKKYTLGQMSGCPKTATQTAIAWCNGKDDTCVKSDTGSCKFDGTKCFFGNKDYCCNVVNGVGVCQAKTTLPGK